MDRWLYALIGDTLGIGGLLFGNLYQAEWAWNVGILLTWLNLIAVWLAVITGIASPEGQKRLFEIYRGMPYAAIFKIYDVLTDVLWVLVLAACGKVFLAVLLAIGKTIRHGLVSQARNFSLETK